MTRLVDLKRRWMADAKFRKEYEAADAEFRVAEALIHARMRAKLTQAQLAKRLGTTQSAVARLESGRTSPSVATLRRYASATGSRLVIDITPAR
jgi:DNA-binding XRE family transcriptional regulator